MEDLAKKNKISPNVTQFCTRAFEVNWPHLADAFIKFLSNRRNKEVKIFLSSVQEHIAKGKIIHASNNPLAVSKVDL